MRQVDLLHALVLWTFVLAPRMTRRLLLGGSQIYGVTHVFALLVLVISLATDLPWLAVVWPLFCAFGFFLLLKNEGVRLLSSRGAVRSLPFAFSLVSATWFVAARSDLHLLGYDRAWSYSASLHGSVLGWLVIGCTAHLAARGSGRLYLAACYVSLPLFLCVAFGIDGVAHVKRIGAVSLSVLVPLVIGRYALDVRGRAKTSFRLALVSFLAVIVSMTLALLNELWTSFPRVLLGMPTMVVVHGCLNAVVVAPGFFGAIACDREKADDQGTFHIRTSPKASS